MSSDWIDFNDEPDFDAEDPDVSTPPDVPDESVANDMLHRLSYWYRERDRIRQEASEERQKIDHREQQLLAQVQHRIEWYERGCAAWLSRIGKRKWRGIRGRISWRKGRQSVDVRDEDAFYGWLERQEEDLRKHLSRTAVLPNKSELRHWIQTTGELPDGVELATSEEQLVVKPED